MKFIDDIRRTNLKALAERKGGVAALAKQLDRSESQISQWIIGSPLPSGKKRGMTSASARWIETQAGTTPGWLDVDHSAAEPGQAAHQLGAPYGVASRKLIMRLCAVAEEIDDAGLSGLIEVARCFAKSHPVKKAKAA